MNHPVSATRPRASGASSPTDSPDSLLAVVADDDEESRNLMAEGLQALGYRVVAAADGAELLERLAEVDTHDRYLVVTDLDMPRVGGFAALDVIAKRFPGARVLVVTGWRDNVVRDEALARGARAVLLKPFSFRHLATLAAKELGTRAARTTERWKHS